MKKLIKNTRKIIIKTKNHLIFNAGMQIIYMNEKCHKGPSK